MGICFSKKAEPSSPIRIPPSNDPPKEMRVTGEKKQTEATEEKPVFAVAAAALTAKKSSCIAEEKEKRKGDTPVKKNSHLEEEKGGKAAPVAATAASDEKRVASLRTSSCTKEEVDAILIQCGRLSRSSSGNTSNETATGHRRYSGSKRSYDFDNEKRKEEDDELDNPVLKPSPRRRTPNRERSGSRERGSSRERKMSRSPVKRSNGSAASSTTVGLSSRQQQQPGKMVSVPAREKGSPFVNGENGGGSLGAKKISAAGAGGLRSASPRSQSPANTTRISNENVQPQSLSRSSSRKAEQSPNKRKPLAEIEGNSTRNHNGGNISMIQNSREMDQKNSQGISQIFSSEERSGREGGGGAADWKANEQAKKPEIAEEVNDVKTGIGAESLNQRTLTRTRSSRRSSRDLDNNSGFNPASYASLLLEDIQKLQQQQHTAFSLPVCASKACSILDVANLNSSCSDHRSHEANQSNNNINKSFISGFEKRELLAQREPFIESELEVKNDLMEPSIHKYVTVRDTRRNVEPQESAGSNSFVEQSWNLQWELNSVDSTGRCGASLSCNGKELEEVEVEVSQGGNQQQQRSWPELTRDSDGRVERLRASTSTSKNLTAAIVTAATPLGKKRDINHSPLRQGGHVVRSGNGKAVGRAISLPVSAATS